jgi:hypothetical protein
MIISKRLFATALALVTVTTPVMAVPTNALLPANPTPAKGQTLKPSGSAKAACLPTSTKTMIGVRYSGDAGNLPTNPNPVLDSYQNFQWTSGKFYCTNNSTINVTGSTATPTVYRKSMYALKLASDSSAVPAAIPSMTYFKPFNWKATGNCTASQNANGYKMDITSTLVGSSTSVTVKLCRDLQISGIGDTARAKSVIFQTIAYYYAPLLNTLILKDRFGNVM